MADALRRPAALAGSSVNDDAAATSEPSPMEVADVESVRMLLRRRWELASVLNFLHVFEPIIEEVPKLSAEDVETAIIEQNSTLAQLHKALLKGIVSGNQAQILKSSDGWMVTLSKTLKMWWRWVAEGDFPLNGAKGEEISIYKELEPISRVVILKALCEVRADQYDAVSYISEKMKSGTEISYFRKDKLAGDGNKVAFWYDGSETIGHRLYKEVHFFEKRRAKHNSNVPVLNCQWETLATNLEEFNNIVNEFSSRESKCEVALSRSLETNVIPVLEKQQRKKQRAQYRQQREQLLWNGFRSSVATRSCRNSKHVDYKFDSFDKAISEAIKYVNKRKTSEELVHDDKPTQKMAPTSDGSNDSATISRDGESTDAERNSLEESDEADDSTVEDYVEKKVDDGNKDGDGDEGKVQNLEQYKPPVHRSKGNRFSRRLAGVPGHTIAESVNLGLKNRLWQRPSINTAVDHMVVSDSEDESSSEKMTEDYQN